MSDLDPGMTTIHLHVLDRTRMRVLALPRHQITVLIGDRTELALFLDIAGIDRLEAVLDEARVLLSVPSIGAAA